MANRVDIYIDGDLVQKDAIEWRVDHRGNVDVDIKEGVIVKYKHITIVEYGEGYLRMSSN